ncbi:hypothetical protein BH23GEM9_BH23GEM9_03340 [soil metagenome]
MSRCGRGRADPQSLCSGSSRRARCEDRAAPCAPRARRRGSAADLPDSPHRAAACSRWPRLLARIYEVFPLTCPGCGAGADMRILAFITAAEPVDAIRTPPRPACHRATPLSRTRPAPARPRLRRRSRLRPRPDARVRPDRTRIRSGLRLRSERRRLRQSRAPTTTSALQTCDPSAVGGLQAFRRPTPLSHQSPPAAQTRHRGAAEQPCSARRPDRILTEPPKMSFEFAIPRRSALEPSGGAG